MRATGRSRRLLPMVVATALALMVLDTAGFAPIIEVRRAVVSVGDPIGRLLAFAVRPVATTWHGAVHYDDLEVENRELRRRNAELAGTLAGQPDAKAELEALLQATEIGFLGDIDRVTARVVADRRSGLERVLEIDKGQSFGLVEGMPVVTGTGLVGVVTIAAADRSIIRLLTDVETAIGVRSRFGIGLVTGTGEGPLRLEPSPELAAAIQSGAVVSGERFVTSGVDRSIYPAGIPVGALSLVFPDGGGQAPREPAGPSIGPSIAGAGADVGTDTGTDAGTDPADSTTQTAKVASAGPAGEPIETPPAVDPRLAGVEPGPQSRPVEITIEPFAALDRLGFVTVLLVEPAR